MKWKNIQVSQNGAMVKITNCPTYHSKKQLIKYSFEYAKFRKKSFHFTKLESPRIKSTPCWLLMRCVTTSPHVVAILKIDILSPINSYFFSLSLYISTLSLLSTVYAKLKIFSENYLEEKWIIITQTLALLVGLHYVCYVSCDRSLPVLTLSRNIVIMKQSG